VEIFLNPDCSDEVMKTDVKQLASRLGVQSSFNLQLLKLDAEVTMEYTADGLYPGATVGKEGAWCTLGLFLNNTGRIILCHAYIVFVFV
jgi:hypothetical protein